MSDESAIHQLIGELKGDMLSSQRQRADLFRMMADVGGQVSGVSLQLAKLTTEFKHHMDRGTALEEKNDVLEARMDALESLRNKLIGAWVVMAGGVASTMDSVRNLFTGGGQ